MRLIDADALFKDINDSINEMTKIGIMVDGEWLWAKLDDALENAPTIEPKKGKWKEHKDYPNLAFLCSECGYFTTMRSHFCPNCGADMREGETDD